MDRGGHYGGRFFQDGETLGFEDGYCWAFTANDSGILKRNL